MFRRGFLLKLKFSKCSWNVFLRGVFFFFTQNRLTNKSTVGTYTANERTHSDRFLVSGRRRATCRRPVTRPLRTIRHSAQPMTRRTVLSTRPRRWSPCPRLTRRCPGRACPPEWPWMSAGFGYCVPRPHRRPLCTWRAARSRAPTSALSDVAAAAVATAAQTLV